jgi:hypothetical protein
MREQGGGQARPARRDAGGNRPTAGRRAAAATPDATASADPSPTALGRAEAGTPGQAPSVPDAAGLVATLWRDAPPVLVPPAGGRGEPAASSARLLAALTQIADAAGTEIRDEGAPGRERRGRRAPRRHGARRRGRARGPGAGAHPGRPHARRRAGVAHPPAPRPHGAVAGRAGRRGPDAGPAADLCLWVLEHLEVDAQ